MQTRIAVLAVLLAASACTDVPDEIHAPDTQASPEDAEVQESGEVIISASDLDAGGPAVDLWLHKDAGPPLPRCDPGEGCFGDPCTQNADCQSNWCVEHMGEKVCTETCQEECPKGWTCSQVAGTGPDLVFVCVSDYPNLCRPCAAAADCAGVAGTLAPCVVYGDQGSFCGGSCGDPSPDSGQEACPWGFSCQEVTTVEGAQLQQCVNSAGICPCTATSVALGLWTPCEVGNEFGVCQGKRFCQQEGLADCDAPQPAAEECNGVDDDCDGDVDEGDLVEGIGVCDDANPCTADKCNAGDGCGHDNLTGTECLDGDPCTVADHCEDGACVGNPVACDDDDPCTDDDCDGAGGCVFVNNAAKCDDGDPCTVADECAQGVCAGFEIPCDCQEDADCAALEDGDLCNGTLYCDLGHWPFQCAVAPETVVECPDPEEGPDAICLTSYCDPSTGECSFVPDHEDLACEDGDACTIGNRCTDGVCTPGTALTCADNNPCTDDSCKPETGCAFTDNEASCSDGNICTTQDLCADGQCIGGPPLSCDDENACNGQETCDPTVGCVPGAPLSCDDANPCNGAELCDPTTGCQAGATPDCDDHNGCTADSCDPTTGCLHEPQEGPCDDGDICTGEDHCQNGACVHTTVQDCNDANLCTTDICDPLAGCTYKTNTALCDDGDLCTVGDVCAVGVCTGVNICECAQDADCAALEDGNLCNGTLVCNTEAFPKHCVVSPQSVVSCAPPNDLCKLSVCVPESGECVLDDRPDGTLCTDHDPCTLDDSCQAGVCAGAPDVCQCKEDAHCAPYDDGDLCNGVFHCDTNVFPHLCVFAPDSVVSCDPAQDDVCLENTCRPEDGACLMTAVNEGGQCDDGNGCTVGDSCAAGSCASGLLCVEVGAVCIDDACVGLVCTPGEKKCQANQVAQCNQWGTQWESEPCPAGHWCHEGTCEETPVVVSWENVNPSPTSNDLLSVWCHSADDCWVVGTAGTILRSQDGGQTWLLLAGVTQSSVTRVRWIDQLHGWLLAGNTLLGSSDGGAKWFDVSPGGTALDFQFLTPQTGWACGASGKVWVTEDGAQSWTEKSSGTLADLLAISMASQTTGWVVGLNGIVRKTVDAGQSWTVQNSGTLNTLRAVHAGDSERAVAVGDGGTVIHTTDGGTTWAPSDGGSAKGLKSVHFANESVGWAAGDAGTLLRTEDAGASFQTVDAKTLADLAAVFTPDPTCVYAVGKGGTIVKSTDGGQSWVSFGKTLTTKTLHAVAWGDDETGVAVGEGGLIMQTPDGGASWEEKPSGVSVTLKDVVMPAAAVGFAVGGNGTVLKTDDGGQTWTPLSSTVSANLEAVAFLDEVSGWASGDNGALVRTQDGGQTWTKLDTGMGGTLPGLFFSDELHGWVGTDWGGMGGSGMVKRTIDGGQFWAYTASAGGNYNHSDWGTRDIWFKDNQEGWGVGRHCCSSQGIVRHFQNGGDQWQVQKFAPQGLLALAFFNQGLGLAVGKSGVLVQSTDGGVSWQDLPVITTNDLNGVAFKPDGEAWIVGGNGVILKAVSD